MPNSGLLFIQACKWNSRANAGLTQADNGQGAHSGLQNVILSREGALSNLKKALSGQLADLSCHRKDILH